MGFGVEYFYYERMEDGNYNKEQLKSMKRKVGEPLDDTPLDTLASKVLAQLARRDIWIYDIKIYEYKKQEITFKETKGGIILKNKKFTLDAVAHDLDAKEVQEQVPQVPQQLSPQQILQMQKLQELAMQMNAGAPVPQKNGNGQQLVPTQRPTPQGDGIVCPVELAGKMPIRAEIYDPEPDHLRAGLVRGKFTPGKKYPIFSEQRDPREQEAGRELPILYVTIDDNGKKTLTPGVAFRPVSGGLIGGNFESRPVQVRGASRGDGLLWDGVQEDDMQDIRRR